MIPAFVRRLAAPGLALAVSAASLVAQASGPIISVDTTPLPPVAGISIQLGAIGANTDAFNTQLALQGRGQLRKTIPTLGVESWVRWNRIMLMAGSHTYVPQKARATNYTTEQTGSFGQVDIGIPVILARTTLVYPLVGIARSANTVTLRRNGGFNFDTSFRDISSVGGRNVEITARQYQAHVGAGLDHVFWLPWPNMLMSIGLRGGYMTSIGDPTWRSGPEKVTGAPELGLKGAYARLTIGGVLGKRRYAIAPMIGSLLPHIGR
ncbi:MAG: hypothetical protein IT355_04320 [Gemmatimonadaceae bacterium]|nr:hypothetical protein [Gemmatimonadaceae bacterium]